MSIRSQFCEFDKETRKYIKKRDNNRCIFCGNNGALQKAHIFLSRAKGGNGCKENGVRLCIKCHQALDNGKDVSLRDQISRFCRSYLIEKENIIDLSSLMKTLKYDKDTKDYYPYYDKYLFEYKFAECVDFLEDEVEIIEEDKTIEKCKWL